MNMSHIVSFRIEGLAGRKESLEFRLNLDTNIFFGLNGSGKTSLLKILHAAMSNRTENLLNVPFSAAEVSIYSITWKQVFTRSIKKPNNISSTGRVTQTFFSPEVTTVAYPEVPIVFRPELVAGREVVSFVNMPSQNAFVWSCAPSIPEEARSTHWAHEYLPTTRLHISDEPYTYWERSPSDIRILTEEQLDLFFARSVEHLWSRYSAQILGAVRKAQEQGLASILRAVLSAESVKQRRRSGKLTPTRAYERVQNFLKRQGPSGSVLGGQKSFEKRYIDDLTLQDVVQDIDSVEDKIEAAMASRNKLQELITRMFAKNKEILFSDEKIDVRTTSGDQIGLASLSSGEKHLLRIFVQALLAGDSTIMIDEPELSMHVDWQKDLIRSLRALNHDAQLIFATHSPEIMAYVPDDKIFRI